MAENVNIIFHLASLIVFLFLFFILSKTYQEKLILKKILFSISTNKKVWMLMRLENLIYLLTQNKLDFKTERTFILPQPFFSFFKNFPCHKVSFESDKKIFFYISEKKCDNMESIEQELKRATKDVYEFKILNIEASE